MQTDVKEVIEKFSIGKMNLQFVEALHNMAMKVFEVQALIFLKDMKRNASTQHQWHGVMRITGRD